jgi:hypothetical protein
MFIPYLVFQLRKMVEVSRMKREVGGLEAGMDESPVVGSNTVV